MSNSADPDLIKVTEIFLVPSSFLVAALGTEDSNPHRTAVSVIGLIVSAMWWVSSQEALAERRPADAAVGPNSRRIRIMTWLPMFFLVSWAVSVVAYAVVWSRPLDH